PRSLHRRPRITGRRIQGIQSAAPQRPSQPITLSAYRHGTFPKPGSHPISPPQPAQRETRPQPAGTGRSDRLPEESLAKTTAECRVACSPPSSMAIRGSQLMYSPPAAGKTRYSNEAEEVYACGRFRHECDVANSAHSGESDECLITRQV